MMIAAEVEGTTGESREGGLAMHSAFQFANSPSLLTSEPRQQNKNFSAILF